MQSGVLDTHPDSDSCGNNACGASACLPLLSIRLSCLTFHCFQCIAVPQHITPHTIQNLTSPTAFNTVAAFAEMDIT